MKLWERLSATICRLLAVPGLPSLQEHSLENTLKQSLTILDPQTIQDIREYVRSNQTNTGGFADKAGNPDLYYTLFGFFLADLLKMENRIQSVGNYVEQEIRQNNTDGVHLYCAAILYAKLGNDIAIKKQLQHKIRESLQNPVMKNSGYELFLGLLTCYYTKDYKSLHTIQKQLPVFEKNPSDMPCPILSALLVLKKFYNKPVDDLIAAIHSLYDGTGGFKVVHTAPVPDLLSTAVAVYALYIAGTDLRRIKPDCLDFTDSLFHKGGFAGNGLDSDPDLEYTFYGLLTLGTLAS